jgi:Flp pilus assembly secretin CpaC
LNWSARPRRGALWLAACCLSFALATPGRAQTTDRDILRVDLSSGRSYPIQTVVPVTNVSVANPEVADVAVVGERNVVINGRAPGETDVILFQSDNQRRHYRVAVRSSTTDRQQVVLGVKIAELRKDALRQFGVSAVARDLSGERLIRGGQGRFNTDDPFNLETGAIDVPNAQFFTLLTDFGTRELLALIEAEEQRGTARILAEPSLAVANRDSASFLAGGELPIPIVQGQAATNNITILFKEFGVRLKFLPEILNDTLVKLRVEPEVSSLDYGNAITISGFQIPAFRTRRVNSTLDVRRNQSIVISGLFNSERERVRTGIPFLSQIPILGMLFGSTRWQNNETELVIVVTPVVYDPLRPRPQDAPRFAPDTTLPAREVLQHRLAPSAGQRPARQP